MKTRSQILHIRKLLILQDRYIRNFPYWCAVTYWASVVYASTHNTFSKHVKLSIR